MGEARWLGEVFCRYPLYGVSLVGDWRKPKLLKTPAVSMGRRNTGMEFTIRRIEVQSFPGALIELPSHLV